MLNFFKKARIIYLIEFIGIHFSDKVSQKNHSAIIIVLFILEKAFVGIHLINLLCISSSAHKICCGMFVESIHQCPI